MKAAYKRDLNHNYLILDGKMTTLSEGYEIKMLMENRVKGFLSMSTRSIDGKISYYYEISSKQSMERIFENREMGYETIKKILFYFKHLLMEAEEFLINTEHLLIQPEYLYMNLENDEMEVAFHPEYKQNMKEAFQNMSEYFLNKVNHEDSKAVILAYQLYKNTRNDNFTMREMLSLLQEDEVEIRETKLFMEEPNYNISNETSREVLNETSKEIPKENKVKTSRSGEKEKWAIALLFLLLLVSLALAKMSSLIEISYQQFMIGAAALIMGIVAVIIKIYLDRKRGIIHEENINYEENIFEKMESEEKEKEEEIEILDFLGNSKEVQIKENYGDTVFLRNDSETEERKLVGKIRGKEVEWQMEHFPFIIGKMGSHVDMEIKDNSISRMHARLIEKEGAIYLEDLNSTNGTYKNDMPLEANETVKLESGDEISFAKIKFLYC